MLRLVLGIAAAVILVVGGLWLLQRRLIYLPTRAVPHRGDQLAGWQEVTFKTSDGLNLAGWYTPPDDDAPVVIVLNGNAGNRGDRTMLGAGIAAEGAGVLLFDYRGYGGNPGHPTEKGLTRDARAALGWVKTQAPGHPVVYFGESLGAAVAVELARAHPPAALVLRSPFMSLGDAAAAHYWFLPVRAMLWDKYPAIDHIEEVTTPTLVILGSNDSIVPIGQSRAIYDAAAHRKQLLVVDGADHNDPALVAGPEVIDATARFITDVTTK